MVIVGMAESPAYWIQEDKIGLPIDSETGFASFLAMTDDPWSQIQETSEDLLIVWVSIVNVFDQTLPLAGRLNQHARMLRELRLLEELIVVDYHAICRLQGHRGLCQIVELP